MSSDFWGIEWYDGPPEEENRPMLQIVRAPEEGRLDLVALSPGLSGVLTHWTEGRTQPCTARTGCVCQQKRVPKRLKFYFHAAFCTNGRTCLAEITREAARQLAPDQRHLRTGGLRGFVISLSRDRTLKGKPVVARITSVQRKPEEMLPPDIDVKAELWRIWTATT